MNQSWPSFSAAERSQSTWYCRPSAGVPSKPETLTPSGVMRDDLVLVELERLAGVLDERGHVGAEEVLALAEADDQRAVAARGHDPAVGSSASTATSVKAPSSRLHTRCIAVVRSTPETTCSSSRCATTSVSVSETSWWPSSSRRARRSSKFSMMPLCTIATRPVAPRCGWALTSLGAPWVAQRVCPMPIVEGGSGSASTTFSRLASLPAFLRVTSAPSSTSAMPAES